MNTTTADPDLAISIWAIVLSIGGLLTNGTVVLLIACNKELRRKDYICFILNRTLIDLFYSIALCTIDPIAILTVEPTSNTCIAAAFVEVTLALASVYAEPLLACNRYISILRSDWYETIYSMRNVYLMCITVWVLAAITVLPHLFVGSLGRVPGSVCIIQFAPDTMLLTVLVNYFPVLISMGSILYFNSSMFRFLRNYQKQPMTNNEKTRLQTDREMLRFMCVAALVPLVLQLPAMVTAWIHMFVPTSSPWIMFGGIGFFFVSFVVNPMITLSMVRPIRSLLVTAVRKAIGRHASSSAVQPSAGSVVQVQPIMA